MKPTRLISLASMAICAPTINNSSNFFFSRICNNIYSNEKKIASGMILCQSDTRINKTLKGKSHQWKYEGFLHLPSPSIIIPSSLFPASSTSPRHHKGKPISLLPHFITIPNHKFHFWILADLLLVYYTAHISTIITRLVCFTSHCSFQFQYIHTILASENAFQLFESCSLWQSYIVYLGSHSHGPNPSAVDQDSATNSHYNLLASHLGR